MTRARSGSVKVGARIGRDLTVLGAIDEGSRDPVYIVWHHRLWCPLACKFFASSRGAREEARVLAALAHPNIVRSFGTGDPPHLLMEFLEGPTLSRMIRERPRSRLPVSDALRVAIHLGGALQHVHERGYLHLDVKPSNVIVARGRPILFDFGTARARNAPRPPDPLGTDEYMAPEACLCEDVTPAADVFGLGVALYKMLTGHLPFPKGSRRRPFPQIGASPTPMRHRRPALPRGLDNLVLACLARDPQARPGVVALMTGLHGFIRSGPPMWPPSFDPLDAARADNADRIAATTGSSP